MTNEPKSGMSELLVLCLNLCSTPPPARAQVKVEDAGFDWKILGPDVQEEEYVAHTCDQDAYAYRCERFRRFPVIFSKALRSRLFAHASFSLDRFGSLSPPLLWCFSLGSSTRLFVTRGAADFLPGSISCSDTRCAPRVATRCRVAATFCPSPPMLDTLRTESRRKRYTSPSPIVIGIRTPILRSQVYISVLCAHATNALDKTQAIKHDGIFSLLGVMIRDTSRL